MAYVLYEGPSLIDGAPVVVLGTTHTRNPKTGPMVQTWIMRSDVNPYHATLTGQDVSICGDCVHRGGGGRPRSCYVNVSLGPLSAWKCQQPWTRPLSEFGRHRAVRIGAYGDPAAVPFEFWHDLTVKASCTTGYTHQWRTCHPGLRLLCMASADSLEEAQEAQEAGWQTFRVKRIGEPRAPGESGCPGGLGHVTCFTCRRCGGLSAERRGNIVIDVHGSVSKIRAFDQLKEVS